MTASAGLFKLVILGVDASRLYLPVVPWLNYFRYFTLTLGNHRLFWEENRKKRTVVMGKLSKRTVQEDACEGEAWAVQGTLVQEP